MQPERYLPEPLTPVVVAVMEAFPFSEVFVHRQVVNLRRHDPLVLCLQRSNAHLFPVERVLEAPHPPLVIRAVGRLRRLAFGGDPAWVSVFVQAARAHRAKLIHTHFLWAAANLHAMRRRLCLPLVVTVHGSDANVWARRPENRESFAELIASTTLFLAVSRSIHDRLIALGVPQDRVRILHNGVPLHEFAPAVTPARAPADVSFGCVARHEPVKGHLYLLEAFRAVRARLPGATLDLIGDGPTRPRLETEARRLGVEGAVRFHGYTANRLVRTHLQALDVFVLPSIVDPAGREEGLPVSLMEASACGLPCIATRTGGIPEVIDDERSGLLVPPKDPAALAAAMLRLACDAPLRHRMGQIGRTIVEERFDLERQTEKLEGIYHDVLRSSDRTNR
jgi:colanic acid/amylovoran biosynthesis glycosyltransferase